MKILLYSLNYSPELTGIGKYNGELVSFLSEHGFFSTVITAPPYYPEWKIRRSHRNHWATEYNAGVTIHRCPLYVPSKPSTLKRIIHLSSFALCSAWRLITLYKTKPDAVFLVQPTLFCAPAALLFCKITGAKSIMHIQDYEVDAMFGLGMGSDGWLNKLARNCESWLMQRFDAIFTISYSMMDNARRKGVKEERIHFFPNWSDTEFVTPGVNGDIIKEELGLSDFEKIVLYSGNIGQKQGLEIVIEAAASFRETPSVHFLIIGCGSYRSELEKLADDQQLKNITFLDLQPWERVPEILAMADVHLVVQKKGAADAVLPSKLTNILSAGGHALVTAEDDTELGLLSKNYPGIFTLVEPEDTSAFTQALQGMLNRNDAGTNQIARNYAVNNLAKDQVMNRFIKDLKEICAVEALKDKEYIG